MIDFLKVIILGLWDMARFAKIGEFGYTSERTAGEISNRRRANRQVAALSKCCPEDLAPSLIIPFLHSVN